MAGPYFVDDGGSGTNAAWSSGSNGDTWERAYPSWAYLKDNNTLASGEIVYVGSNAAMPALGASWSLVGPTSGGQVIVMSSTVSTGTTVSYSAGTANQISTVGGAYTLTFDGSFALYGLMIASGDNITLSSDDNEGFLAVDCYFKPASNRTVQVSGSSGSRNYLRNCTVDCAADTSGAKTNAILNLGFNTKVEYLSVINAAYRSGPVFGYGIWDVSGLDISGCTYSTGVYLAGSASATNTIMRISNVKTYSTFAGVFTGTLYPGTEVLAVNYGVTDDPSKVGLVAYPGTLTSTQSIYRSSGASVEDVSTTSWGVVTNGNCTEHLHFTSPWIYGTISSTGSKTFSIAIANNTADLKESEAWIEVEYLGTSDSPLYSLASDQRIDYAAASPSDQTDDTTSTWNGTTLAYMQTLSKTATVGEAGLYRARVCIGKASSTVYVDPKVTVS